MKVELFFRASGAQWLKFTPAEERTPALQAELPVSTAEDDDLIYEVDGDDLGMVELKPTPRQQAE